MDHNHGGGNDLTSAGCLLVLPAKQTLSDHARQAIFARRSSTQSNFIIDTVIQHHHVSMSGLPRAIAIGVRLESAGLHLVRLAVHDRERMLMAH